MDLQEFLTALAEDLSTAGFDCYTYVPDRIDPPCFVVSPLAPGFTMTYDDAGMGTQRITLPIRFYQARADAEDGQIELVKRMGTGAGSVKDTIEAVRSAYWGSVSVLTVSGAGTYSFGQIDYYGAEWLTEFLA